MMKTWLDGIVIVTVSRCFLTRARRRRVIVIGLCVCVFVCVCVCVTAILCNDLLFKIIGQFVQKCILDMVRDSSDV